MKLPNRYLLLSFACFVMSSSAAQASYFECPAEEDCSYATDPVATADVTDLLTDGDITGGPLFNPNSGLILAATAGSNPSPSSMITAEMADPIYQSLWIVTNELVTPAELNERMEVLVSTNNGGLFTSLGNYFNYNANDPAAEIDLSFFGITDINPVTHVQIKGISPGLDLECFLTQPPGTDCTSFTNPMEILGIAGITAPASAVPVPAALWLFGSGLLGLAVAGRRRNK